MITQALIRNFRCLREVDLTLGPLTVFVGPNASGKSALMQALANPANAQVPADVWQQRTDVDVDWDYRTDDGIVHGLKLRPQGGVVPNPVWKKYHSLILRLDLNAMRRANQVNRASELATNGDNLANVFATLTRRQQQGLASQLIQLVPVISDVDVLPTDRGNHELRFQDRWTDGLWYTPDQVSDGTILLVAFLTLQFMDPPVQLLAIEEPERGLHPYLLDQLVRFLRDMSTGKIGKAPIQVVMATHSAELLDVLKPEEVRFLSRNREDGSVRVETAPTASPEWEKSFDVYRRSLGSAWLSGGLGGVPGGADGSRHVNGGAR